MSFGISQSVRSREVRTCTPELFHQATRSGRVKDVCAQIEDALERKRRGEICREDYDTMKTQLKSQLPILTPHATFRNGRRINADAIPSGLSIYDKDHIPDPRGYWEEKKRVLAGKKIGGTKVSADLQSAASGEQASLSASPEEQASLFETGGTKVPADLQSAASGEQASLPASPEEQASLFETGGTNVPADLQSAASGEQASLPASPEEQASSVLDLVVLAHVTPSLEGLRLVFVIPDGMNLAEAQRWMSQQLEDDDYDSCVKDLARPSYIVPEEYILYINEPELFRDRTVAAGMVGDCKSPRTTAGTTDSAAPQLNTQKTLNTQFNTQHSTLNTQLNTQHSTLNTQKTLNTHDNDNRLSGPGGSAALPAGLAAQHAQPAAGNAPDAAHICPDGGNQSAGGMVGDCKSPQTEVKREEGRGKNQTEVKSEEGRGKNQNASPEKQENSSLFTLNSSLNSSLPFPREYDGIPYDAICRKLVELLGGEPEHGSRNSFIFTLSCYLRYLCDDNREWIKQVIPTFGEERQRAFATVDSACSRKQSHRMPSIVVKAIHLCRSEGRKGKAEDFDADDFGDIHNPDSYFYRIHEMPEKLPRLIKLLVSKTPAIYQPAVSQAVFPALGAHLCDVRFRYIDNVEHEATLMSILCAPTGSGKESITEPINRIMADIRQRDAEQRERERQWKDECNRKGSNKDKRERPEGLVIQEVNIDMTNPAFVLRMKEAERHFLYAKVNELNLFDALRGKTNQHFRIMELAFDLGNYGQDRVGVQSVTETVKVRFNWNACCTPRKCRDYFRRVVTDGPISRISFSTIERRPCGSAMPIYGTYDAAFDEDLRPYIDNLVKARGLVDCPQALRLAKRLVEENAEFSRLSQNYVFENLSFRANVIAYLKACVLYVANGMKWERAIEDFVRWSERYDLWCKLKLFGQMIYDADGEQEKISKTAPYGPRNLLTLLPDEFTMEDYVKVRRQQGFDDENRKRVRDALSQWVHRGYVVKMEGADADTDRSIFRKVRFRRKAE